MKEEVGSIPELPGVALQAAPSSMVERVAFAMASRKVGEEVAALSRFQGGNIWCEAKADARAALEAMREPTEAQYEALAATGLMWRELDSKTVWQTYIDAALSPLPELLK